MKDWVSLLVWLLASVWCFSFFCWVGPTVPGVWGEGCVSVQAGVDEDLCADIVDSDKWLGHFPKTHMQENMRTCQSAGRCNYVGVKIGEALRAVEDRDLLTMMLVFMMNTLVFCTAVLIRSSGHRCQRSKADGTNHGAVRFDLNNFDTTPSLIPDTNVARPTDIKSKVTNRLKSMRSSRADELLGQADAATSHGVSSFEVESGGTQRDSPSPGTDADSLGLEKISMEMMGLISIVRQPDELVYVHCGADAYLYMRYQKYMINMLWVMLLVSLVVLLPNQYSHRDSIGADTEFLNTFYLWANAANLPGKDDGGGRMYPQLVATYFFSILVFIWLAEFRKLMVKLQDPTFVQELTSKVQDVERWGAQDDSNRAALEDAITQEARSRTLIVQGVPTDLSRAQLRSAIQAATGDQLLAVHVPLRHGRSMLSRTGLAYFQPRGSGSGVVFLTFRQRAHARRFRDAFKRMDAKNKQKQSLQVDLGAVGTFGVDLGVELPTFVQETIDRVTDVDAHLESVLTEIETNVVRAEDATESVTQVLRNLICCWPQRGASIEPQSNSPQSSEPAGDSSIVRTRSASPSRQAGPDSPTRQGSPTRLASPALEDDDGNPRGLSTGRNATSGESPGDVEHFTNALADGVPTAGDLAQAAVTESMRGRGRSDPDLDFPESFNSKKWKVNWAPERNDVVWSNLHISDRERKLRKLISFVVLTLAFFTIAFLYNKYAMERSMTQLLTEATKDTTGIEEGAMFDNSLNGKSYQFGKLIYGMETIYAPVIVLCLVNYGILPVLCMVSATLEGRRKNSSIHLAVLRRNYVFMMINILILPMLALKTPDAFMAQFKQMSDNIQMAKTYDWQIGYCHNGCLCYGASSFHVCDETSFSEWEKLQHDEEDNLLFHPCDRQPCQPGDVPGDSSKPERYGSVGPGGDPKRLPDGHPTWGCYNASTGQNNNIMASWKAAHGTEFINGCSRNSSTAFGEPGGPDYYHLWPVCQESKVYCHHVTVACHGICETNDYLKIIGNFVLASNASFLYCFVVSASLLGTGWQLLNLAFYVFCLVQIACKKTTNATDSQDGDGDGDGDDGIEFWDIAAGADKVQQTMKENGWAFEIGYYYAVGLVIFAIVIFYSVHFPPVSFAGLLYFNCKVCTAHASSSSRAGSHASLLAYCVQHFVDKYNLLFVYPVDAQAGHVRSGGQMGGTVHDMVLFSLCFMQLGMAAFFKVKDPESARFAIYIFAVSLAWYFVSVRRASPASSEIIFGDENIEILDVPSSPAQNGARTPRQATAPKQAKHLKSTVTIQHLAEAYAQPEDRPALNEFQ